MLAFFAIGAGLLAILLAEELSWRKKILHGEYQRKFSHILVGVFAASWPWFTSWKVIQFYGLALLVSATVNHYTKWFNFLAGIRRRDFGHVLFPLAFLLCASLTDHKLFFTLAILQLALADGLAAVIGTAFGKKTSYKVFGATKSLTGSVTFWLVSLVILSVGPLFQPSMMQPTGYSWIVFVLPPALTILENLAVRGLDNIVVPIVTLLVLNKLY